MRAVHRCAPLPGDALMMSLFSSLPMLPAVPQLQYTVALTVGAYADWLSDTAQRGEEGRTLLSQVRAGVCRGSWASELVAGAARAAGLVGGLWSLEPFLQHDSVVVGALLQTLPSRPHPPHRSCWAC